MEIRKRPVVPLPLVVPLRQHEAAAVSRKPDTQRLRGSEAYSAREPKVYTYDPDELRALVQGLENRRAAEESGVRQPSSTITSRTREALRAYQSQIDMSQDEAHTALRQMLGIDAYA